MSAFKASGRTIRSVKVPAMVKGRVVWKKRTTGTRHAGTAAKMTAMVRKLADLRAFDVLARVTDGPLSVPALYDLWLAHSEDVTAIRAVLNDVDLLTKHEAWQANVLSGAGQNTADYYARALASLVKAIGTDGALRRSACTTEAITSWLDGLRRQKGQQYADATRRKYYAGVSSFFAYCVTVAKILDRSPMADVKAPGIPDPRDRHLSPEDAKRLADAQPSPFRELSALLTGSGVEVGIALRLKVRDVDVGTKEITAKGGKQRKGKTHRNRQTSVAGWAWPYVLTAIAGKLPETPLFSIPGALNLTHANMLARKEHIAACARLGIEDYTMRDGRHSFAVRMVKVGTPTIQVGKLLGHVDGTMVSKVYGQYEPTQAERSHWEQIAATADVEQAQTRDAK